MTRNMTYSTAICSGSVDRSGKVEIMSVKTLERGCACVLREGFRSEETEG